MNVSISLPCMPLGKFLETLKDFLTIIFTRYIVVLLEGEGSLSSLFCHSESPERTSFGVFFFLFFKLTLNGRSHFYVLFIFISSLSYSSASKCYTLPQIHISYPETQNTVHNLASALLVLNIPHFIAPMFHTDHSLIFCCYSYILVFVCASLSFCQKQPDLFFMACSRCFQTIRAKKVSTQ